MEFVSSVLLTNVLLLGFRHGFDWDHMAAILDIVGTVKSSEGDNTLQTKKIAVYFALLYALGHAFICVLLGIFALSLRALLPEWIDPFFEKLVGLTLIFLGVAILQSIMSGRRHEQFLPQSRWMFLIQLVESAKRKLHFGNHNHEIPVRTYGARTAFGIGMLHGIGAETASQVLMIVAVSHVANFGAKISVLLVFVFGLLMANTIISLSAATGYVISRPSVQIAFGLMTGIFSVVLGTLFLLGVSI